VSAIFLKLASICYTLLLWMFSLSVVKLCESANYSRSEFLLDIIFTMPFLGSAVLPLCIIIRFLKSPDLAF